ncbi:MAG: hypothetical protein WC326_08340 [Candidatus Delongbacteria bacterium]
MKHPGLPTCRGLTLQQALAYGYCITSRRYRHATRLDRADWREVMAKGHVSGMPWVMILGTQAADYYRRCHSRHKLIVPAIWLPLMPNSNNGPTEFLPRPEKPARKDVPA